MSNQKRIGAVVTAAGLSTRMKAFKQTLPIGGKSMVEHVVSRFEAVGADPIVVVTGYRGKEVRRALADRQVTFLENPDFETTQMFDTVRIGLNYIRGLCDRVFITPVDVPLFSVDTLCREIGTDGDVIIPEESGVTGHPVLIDTAVLPAILTYSGDRGLRGAIENSGAETVYVSIQDQGAMLDADTQDDYRELLHYYDKSGRTE